MLRISSFLKWLPLLLSVGIAHSQPVQKPLEGAPHFTIHDAIQAEWMRAAPNLKADALPKADRERYKLALQRIGAPGMPKLLPPEQENPTAEIWEAKAKEAKTPQERFTALHFLNRLKSPRALGALDGLKPEDAKAWPRHLHLDANIATARLQGGEVSKELQTFLDGLKAEGKVEPVRAQAARLRLVMAGKEPGLFPLVTSSPGSILAMFDALGRSAVSDCDVRLSHFLQGDWNSMGLTNPPSLKEATSGEAIKSAYLLALSNSRALELCTNPLVAERSFEMVGYISGLEPGSLGFIARRSIQFLDKVGQEQRNQILPKEKFEQFPLHLVSLALPALRKVEPLRADLVRNISLVGSDPIARSAAIEDLAEAPPDLDALTQLTWKDHDLEPQQTLIESFSRWKLPKEKQIELLKPWLLHPDWACRFLAYQQLVKLDSTTPWPAAPEPNEREKTLLKEAERLAASGKPLRLCITFSGKRHVTLRLDPAIAPINVANLALLARKGFFNGRLVPRVVPDFVVQMGSPYDTMDGGPGYSVRCEDSLAWYGPGSVGMALSGKDTGGSQFFITTNATPHLTGKYTRLGEVEDLDGALMILDDLELGAKIERVEVLN